MTKWHEMQFNAPIILLNGKHGIIIRDHGIKVGVHVPGEEEIRWIDKERLGDNGGNAWVEIAAPPPRPVSELSLEEVIVEIDAQVHLGDLVYQVRDRAADNAPRNYTGSSWDLPEVQRYGDLCTRLAVLLRERGFNPTSQA